MMKMVGKGRSILWTPLARKGYAVSLVVVSTVLVVLSGLLEWRWLPFLAAFCWLLVFAGMHLSIRLRSGHVIRSLASIEATLSSLNEKLTRVEHQSAIVEAGVDAVRRQYQEGLDEVINMQLRSYRDLSAQRAALQLQLVDMIAESKASIGEVLNSKFSSFEHENSSRFGQLSSLVQDRSSHIHGVLLDGLERSSLESRAANEGRLLAFEQRQLAAFSEHVQWLASTIHAVTGELVGGAAQKLQNDLHLDFVSVTSSLEHMATAAEAVHSSHHQYTRDHLADSLSERSESLMLALSRLEGRFDGLQAGVVAEHKRQSGEAAERVTAFMQQVHAEATLEYERGIEQLRMKLEEAIQASRIEIASAHADASESMAGSLLTAISAEQKRESGEVADRVSALLQHSQAKITSEQERFSEQLRLKLEESIQKSQIESASVHAEVGKVLAGMSEAAIQQSDVNRRHLVQLRAAVGEMSTTLNSYPAILSGKCDAILASLADPRRVRSVTTQGMQWMKTEVVQEVESLLRLYELGSKRGFSPLLGGWAMDPAGMLGVLRLIEQTDPELVVELGSGTSTLWIASCLKARGKGRLVSIDHLLEYGQATASQLTAMRLDDVAEVRVAPLELQAVGSQEFSWYGAAALEGIENIDFLLVDGPPTATGPLARYPALPLLGAALASDACVLLDDTTRKDEQETIRLWRSDGWELHDLASIGARTQAFQLSSKKGFESKKEANEK